MEQVILTHPQRQFLDLVQQREVLVDYYLSGGTALAAFYLHHRLSDDLDFFTARDVEGEAVQNFIEEARLVLGASSVRKERVHDWHLYFFTLGDGELKVEFTYYPFVQLQSPQKMDGVSIDSIRDIAANKLAAMLDRFDPKDFVDLYFLLQKTSLADVRRDTEQKFVMKISPLFLGGELLKVRRIEVLPKMVVPLTIQDLKVFFEDQARGLMEEVL